VDSAAERLASARAELAGAQASFLEKTGEIAVARRAAEYAERDFGRQNELAQRKLVPAATLDTAHRAADIATGTISVLELQRAQLLARLGGRADHPVDDYPPVRAAADDLERARVDLGHAHLYAPQAGVISHLPKIGSHLDAGRPAFAIVSDRAVWVEANFKETDLEWVRPGQPVEIDIDTYAAHRWSGRVQSIAQATGAAFSLLPAQNASGNWVKVVQRIPVRIVLQPGRDDPPLRDGMSASVRIDTGAHSRFDRWFGRGH
jgi:membrane fusion protein (multidrug efflux system)